MRGGMPRSENGQVFLIRDTSSGSDHSLQRLESHLHTFPGRT